MTIVTEKTIKRIPSVGMSEERLLAHINSDPIEHADNSIPISKIKYQTENVSFAYFAFMNKLNYVRDNYGNVAIVTKDDFADKSIIAFGKYDGSGITFTFSVIGRLQNYQNYYRSIIFLGDPASDHRIEKYVAGVRYFIATEAVDLTAEIGYIILSCVGSTIKSMRFHPITAPVDIFNLPTSLSTISAIDTAFAMGRFGIHLTTTYLDIGTVYLLPQMSPSPQILGIYEVEITGDGSLDNPFRPNLPSKLEFVEPAELDKYPSDLQLAIKLNKDQKVDRLALSYNAFIPTDEATGLPLDKKCLVFVFEQKERQPHLYDIKECLDEIEKRPEVKKHDKKSAKEEMFKRDKKLEKEKEIKEKEVDEFLGI